MSSSEWSVGISKHAQGTKGISWGSTLWEERGRDVRVMETDGPRREREMFGCSEGGEGPTFVLDGGVE